MMIAGTITMKVSKHWSGCGYHATFQCPAAGCGATARALGPRETGPFEGRCSSRHQIIIPTVEKRR